MAVKRLILQDVSKAGHLPAYVGACGPARPAACGGPREGSSSVPMAMRAIRAAAPPSPSDSFEAERAAGEPAFKVDVDGFEGPLDLLLELARRQKVDLAKISILELANQYLAFIEAARKVRLELAADYLVMAAWLAYLKSRLLLPAPPKGAEPDPNELAANLAQRLRRLQAIRVAA